MFYAGSNTDRQRQLKRCNRNNLEFLKFTGR